MLWKGSTFSEREMYIRALEDEVAELRKQLAEREPKGTHTTEATTNGSGQFLVLRKGKVVATCPSHYDALLIAGALDRYESLKLECAKLHAELAEREPVPFAERLPPEGVDIIAWHMEGWWEKYRRYGDVLINAYHWEYERKISEGYTQWLLPTVKPEAAKEQEK